MSDWLSLEALAVVFSLAYLVLAMRENSLCWFCAFFGTAIYIWVFGGVSLYMGSLLHVYYLVMAVYGWYQWRRGGVGHRGRGGGVQRLCPRVRAAGCILLATGGSARRARGLRRILVEVDQDRAAPRSAVFRVGHVSLSPIRNSAARSSRMCGGPSPGRRVSGAGAKRMIS